MVTRVAVVGHVEWVDFVCVARYPLRGEVAHARGGLSHAAGGGVVAAAVLADLGADVDFFCALGRDANGARGRRRAGRSRRDRPRGLARPARRDASSPCSRKPASAPS